MKSYKHLINLINLENINPNVSSTSNRKAMILSKGAKNQDLLKIKK